MKVRLNPDKAVAVDIKNKVKENGGYCPCRIKKNEDTKCPCKEFREQTTVGLCHCGLFEKVENDA